MRRATSVGIVLLVLANAGLTNVAGAQEKTTLSSLVRRLLKIKKSPPVEQEFESPAVQTTAPAPRYEPQAQLPPPAGRRQQPATKMRVTRLPEAGANSLPYPPSPPAVNQAWIHPPRHEQERDYTTKDLLALTRHASSGESRRRSFQTPPSRASALAMTDSNPANSHVGAPDNPPLIAARRVNHVTKMAVPAVKGLPIKSLSVESLPIESLSFERKPVGNTPAEVRDPMDQDSEEIEPVRPAKPLEIVQAAEVPLPTSTLPPVFQKVRGQIAAIDVKTGVVQVDLLEEESLPAGTRIQVYHKTQVGKAVAVHMKVLKSVAGAAAAQLIDGAGLDSVAPGDKTVAWKTGADQ
ncbi:MAG: hypothetical protein QF918_03810 [Pirellulaceae bacterium]|nr:hypothetical protein [Pirellulaceae bacterium]MDP6554397.1 hypothetical protein [Pirellulaceae bacterium]MDP6722638.1 hypothetical protein [Pirellulaceae bacterium]